MYIYIYIYICVGREREGERGSQNISPNITFHIMNTFTKKYKIIATIKLHTDQTQILGICGSVKKNSKSKQ